MVEVLHTPDPGGRLIAVHDRHLDIHQDRVIIFLLRDRHHTNCLTAVAGFLNLKSGLLEQFTGNLHIEFIVLDNKDPLPVGVKLHKKLTGGKVSVCGGTPALSFGSSFAGDTLSVLLCHPPVAGSVFHEIPLVAALRISVLVLEAQREMDDNFCSDPLLGVDINGAAHCFDNSLADGHSQPVSGHFALS